MAREPSGQEKRRHVLVVKRRGGTVSWSREEEVRYRGQEKRVHSREEAQPSGQRA